MTTGSNPIINNMFERHSIRKYTAQKIPKEVLEKLVQAAGSAPSAWNLQQWKFVIVQEQDRKDQLGEAAFGQPQVKNAAAVVVVLGDVQANLNAEEIYAGAVSAGMPEAVKNNILSNVQKVYGTEPEKAMILAYQNSAFAAMQLMLAAKAEGIDSCAMSGFDPQAVRGILNIPERYIPVLFITLGYGDGPARGNTRLPLEKILVYEKFGTK